MTIHESGARNWQDPLHTAVTYKSLDWDEISSDVNGIREKLSSIYKWYKNCSHENGGHCLVEVMYKTGGYINKSAVTQR